MSYKKIKKTSNLLSNKLMKKIILILNLILINGCIVTVNGRPWNKDLKCWGHLQHAGTTDEANYDDGTVIAKAPDGTYWLFLSPAIPDDFVEGDFESDPNRPVGTEYCQ